VDYVSGRQTIFRGSLGSDDNVCTMPFPLWFNYSHLSALWLSSYIWPPCLYLIQWKCTSTGLSLESRCRSIASIWWQLLGAGTHLSSQTRRYPHPTIACLLVYVSVLFIYPRLVSNHPPQCTLSDSVLAWRCYVIFGKRRWLKWTLTAVVFVVTGMYCLYLCV
jgi:hypothetical protein